MTQEFEVVVVGRVRLRIEDAVINDVLTDEWRADFYPLHNPQQVADHIGYNLLVNHREVSSLDGFADREDSTVRVLSGPVWAIWTDDGSG